MDSLLSELHLRSGDTVYPFSAELRDHLRKEDYHIEPLGGAQPTHLLVHGINKQIATEEAALNGVHEFIYVDQAEELSFVRL